MRSKPTANKNAARKGPHELRVVADTNVLISAFLTPGAPREFLWRCASRQFILVTSPEILIEFTNVIDRPKIRTVLEDREAVLATIIQLAHIIETTSTFHVVKEDPDDDKILAAAVDAKADTIVTGDRHLLGLQELQEIPIRRVADLLALHPSPVRQ